MSAGKSFGSTSRTRSRLPPSPAKPESAPALFNAGSGSTELVAGGLLTCIHAPTPAYVAQTQES